MEPGKKPGSSNAAFSQGGSQATVTSRMTKTTPSLTHPAEARLPDMGSPPREAATV